MSSTERAVGLGPRRDRLAQLAAELAAMTDELAGDGDWQGAEVEVDAVLESVVRLYTASCEGTRHRRSRGSDLDLTPTQACTVAAALRRSQLLTPFEFAIWYSGGRENDPGAGPG